MEGKNSAYTKQYNRRRVLSLLRQTPMSRAELARQMGLTRAALSLITEELISEGLVRESKSICRTPGPGRFPTLLKLQGDAMYAVGVSLERDVCYVGVEDLSGKILKKKHIAPERLEDLLRTVKTMLKDLPKEKVLGIGVAAPGPVDSENGMILNPPNFEKWAGCPICKELSQATGLPAWLENDANAAALYNRRSSDFAEKDNFLLLYVSDGVGSGAVSQGRLLRSCELGHVSIDYHGAPCSCGNRGCLEQYASLKHLAKSFGFSTWQELMESDRREEALNKEAEYLSAAILNFSNMISIGAVLLDGQLQPFSSEILPLIRERISGRSMSGKQISLLPAISDQYTPIRSACSTVFSRWLDTDREVI